MTVAHKLQITLQIWQEFCMFMYRFKYATSETCQGEHEERTWCCEWLLPIKAVWAKLRMGTPEQWQKKAHHIIITSVTLRQLSRREVTHGNSNSLINIKTTTTRGKVSHCWNLLFQYSTTKTDIRKSMAKNCWIQSKGFQVFIVRFESRLCV